MIANCVAVTTIAIFVTLILCGAIVGVLFYSPTYKGERWEPPEDFDYLGRPTDEKGDR